MFFAYLFLESNHLIRIVLFIPFVGYPIVALILIILIIAYSNCRELCLLPKKMTPHILEYSFPGYDTFIEVIQKKAYQKGYIYNRQIFEEGDYAYTVFTKVDTENSLTFPDEKIAIYKSKYDGGESLKFNRYNREIKVPKIYVMGKELNYINDKTFEFLRMFTNKKGHFYSLNAQWVTVDSIVIIIVDDFDKDLELILNYSLQELYVLYCVISLQNPNKMYIAQDNRILKASDFINKFEELKELLGINDVNDEN